MVIDNNNYDDNGNDDIDNEMMIIKNEHDYIDY